MYCRLFIYVVGHLCNRFHGSGRPLKDTPGTQSNNSARRMKTQEKEGEIRLEEEGKEEEEGCHHCPLLGCAHGQLDVVGAEIRQSLDRVQVSRSDIEVLSLVVKGR